MHTYDYYYLILCYIVGWIHSMWKNCYFRRKAISMWKQREVNIRFFHNKIYYFISRYCFKMSVTQKINCAFMLFVLNWFFPTSKSKMHGILDLKERLVGVHCANPYNLVHFIFIQMNSLSQLIASVSTHCSHSYTLLRSHGNTIVIHRLLLFEETLHLPHSVRFHTDNNCSFDRTCFVHIIKLLLFERKKKSHMWIFNMHWVIFIHIMRSLFTLKIKMRSILCWNKTSLLMGLSTEIFQMTNRPSTWW